MRQRGLRGYGISRGGISQGFTLIELLVVIGIITVLLALLLPVLNRAREHAKLVQCASNMRQLLIALQGYASNNRQRFPINVSAPAPGTFWYDQERIGKHLTYTPPVGATRPGGVFVCPNDDNSLLSYSMNVWASSRVDPLIDLLASITPPRGTRWSSNVRNGSQMVLVVESWSGFGSASTGFYADPYAGHRGPGATPGLSWGAGIGVAPPFSAGRWGQVNCELPYIRHRKINGPGKGTQAMGRVNVGYCDGHVAVRAHDDLADPLTGNSRRDSFWSPGF